MTILDGSDRYGLLKAEIFNKMPLFPLQFTDTRALHEFYSFSNYTRYRVQWFLHVDKLMPFAGHIRSILFPMAAFIFVFKMIQISKIHFFIFTWKLKFTLTINLLEWVMETNGVLIKHQTHAVISICIKIPFKFNWNFKIIIIFCANLRLNVHAKRKNYQKNIRIFI